jgi:hypothetical protein
MYSRKKMRQLKDNLSLQSEEKVAYAMEILDITLSSEIKSMVFPMIENLAPTERAKRLIELFPQSDLTRSQYFEHLITNSNGKFNPCIQAFMIYMVGQHDMSSFDLSNAILTALRDPNATGFIKETAVWSLNKIVPELLMELSLDDDPLIADLAKKHLDVSQKETEAGLSILEKVMVLKNVNLFAKTPDEILVDLAGLMQEDKRAIGDTIINKDDHGDCMFAIVKGKVKIHDGDIILNHLEAGEVIGEMALLDSSPRLASVTAVENTQLLRLDQASFYALIEERIEFLRSIIHVLSDHLKHRVKDISELKQQLQELGYQNDFQ